MKTDHDEQVYASVSEEMEKGEFNKALWAKAFALSGGVEAAIKSHYCRLRVEQLQAAAKKLDSTARRTQAKDHAKDMCWGLLLLVIGMVITSVSYNAAEPGGLTVREALTLLHRIAIPVVGADIVEYNPQRDVNVMTAYVAAKLAKELAAIMAR